MVVALLNLVDLIFFPDVVSSCRSTRDHLLARAVEKVPNASRLTNLVVVASLTLSLVSQWFLFCLPLFLSLSLMLYVPMPVSCAKFCASKKSSTHLLLGSCSFCL